MAAGDIGMVYIGVQNICLLLQLMNIGVKIIAIQIADIFSARFPEQTPTDRIETFYADIRRALFAWDKIHNKNPHRVRVFLLPSAQFFHRIVRGAVIRTEHLVGEICLLRKYALQSLIYIGFQIVKRDQDTDLRLCHMVSSC